MGKLVHWVNGHRGLSISIVCHFLLILSLLIAAPTVVREYKLNSAAQPQIVHASVIQIDYKKIAAQKRAAKLKMERLHQARLKREKARRLKLAKIKKAKIEKARKEKLAKQERARKLKLAKQKQEKIKKEKLRNLAMKNLLQKIADQQKAEAAAKAMQQRTLTERQKYIALVTQIIRANWINQFADTDYQVTLKINVDKSGDVQSVSVVKSSGNSAFDRQAALAVQKSSPLPVPKAQVLQVQMRSMTLAFSNQGLG